MPPAVFLSTASLCRETAVIASSWLTQVAMPLGIVTSRPLWGGYRPGPRLAGHSRRLVRRKAKTGRVVLSAGTVSNHQVRVSNLWYQPAEMQGQSSTTRNLMLRTSDQSSLTPSRVTRKSYRWRQPAQDFFIHPADRHPVAEELSDAEYLLPKYAIRATCRGK